MEIKLKAFEDSLLNFTSTKRVNNGLHRFKPLSQIKKEVR